MLTPKQTLKETHLVLNQTVEQATEALEKSTKADVNSNTALTKARSVQNQLNTIIIESGTSDAETLQMRVGEDGVIHATASERLISDFQKLFSFFNKNETNIEQLGLNVKAFGAKGDGITDDSLAIQKALNAAGNRVNRVIIPDGGTYLIKSPLKIKSNTVLEIGSSTTIKRGANINNMIRNDSNGLLGRFDASSNIEINGGIWDANGSEFPTNCSLIAIGHAKNIRVIGAKFKGIYNWHYIEYNAVQDGLVRDCLFEGYISSDGTEMVQIDVMRDSGVFPWFGPYDNYSCDNITIASNIFRNGRKGFGSHTMVESSPHTNVNVLDNYFYGMTNVALDARHYSRFLAKGNSFENCWKGIMVQSFDKAVPVYGCTIDGNTFSNMNTDSDARAIQIWTSVNRGVIVNNVINAVGRHGIGIDYGRWWVVKGNVVTNCAQAGIFIYASDHVTIEGNNCSVNNTSNTADRFDITIGYHSSDENLNNIVTGNYAESIGVKKTVKTIVTNNIFLYSKSSLVEGNNTNLKAFNNFIASNWT